MIEDFEPNEEGLLNLGDGELDSFDDGNVPVDIWFVELNKDGGDEEDNSLYDAGYRFRLCCGNYMPRRGQVLESAVKVYAKDRLTLQKAVEKYILPFYQLALRKVTKMATEGKGHLYYWDEKDE